VVQNAVQGADNLGFIVMCSDNKPIAEDLSKDITDKKEIIPWKILMECPYPKLPDCPAIDIDLATIVYTSGSTGEPKGVMSTHHNVISAATSITQYIRNTSEDIILNALPLSFDYGLYQIFMGFMFGCTIVIEKSFVYPYKVLERLVKEKVTGFPLVPTMLSLLFKMDDIGQFDFSNLRYISNTAAALPEAHIKRFSKLFPHVQIFSMYGLTECKRVSYLPPEDALKKPGSVGIPIPNEVVMILDENGREVPPGTVGELVIRGANVMQGYWNAPEETQKVFREGRYKGETLLYSGDYFKMDEEGYLYFISRKDDLIKTKGERVSPKEIENVLYRIDEVLGAAVVGIDDDIDGTVIVAFVQKDEKHELKEAELKKFCKINLESYMVPKYFFIRDHLPKNNSGKIDKKMLLNEAVNFFGLDKPKN
jgi:acyl-CoA synthetase (AMP-forming)/AMP-acid ligase II